ncbi:ankyrin repeat domain-containing protein [Streptomyces bathyalis]|nr:ankyrin repeat domain-containing protein [Streptomyces bathyalis]
MGEARGRPLHEAAETGSAEAVAELAARADDVDALDAEGRTALWAAVCWGRADVVEVLLAAGADPWREVLHGWSPGRLALATPLLSSLVQPPPGDALLTAEELATAAEAARLAAVFEGAIEEGAGVTFVGGRDAGEAVRRLGAEPCDAPDDEYDPGPSYVGVTPVDGGCALAQPLGFEVTDPHTLRRLSAGGAVAYGVHFNAKSGSQGGFSRDGQYEDDSLVGLPPSPGDAPERLLLRFLHGLPDSAGELGYACAMTGVRPRDAAAVTGPPHQWVQVRDWV